ncbi:MAG: SPOR domain-containing protein [Gammaproteobacteria bacterium]|nr:SPOR domain-containing protein [Gammaproteobacteria bacterium]MCY4210526.1 SPOR domain-containing protein [Gammaproteobacteria bacterium]MCY4283139.1 SPOR domain-containing protein [Gammaproteobacteria bacterium]MCY4339282.1 SPOR domain-containing protein [Gammaproteobacteria bacterium]
MRFLSFLSGLSLGLLVAFIVFLRYQVVDPEPDTGQQARAEQEQPDVTFTFYDTLRNKKVNISEWMAGDKDSGTAATGVDALTVPGVEPDRGRVEAQQQPATPDRSVTQPDTVYVLQAGSFKDFNSADEVKAQLALLGLFADIQRVMLNEKDIRHRVRLGPFNSAREMRAISRTLKDNNMDFLVLELRAGQGLSAN